MTKEEPKPLCAPSYLTDKQREAIDLLMEQSQELGLYDSDIYKFKIEEDFEKNKSFE